MSTWLKNHRNAVLFCLTLLVFAGLYVAFKLPVSLFPSIEFPRIEVIVDSGDRPVNRMVLEVTIPLEQAIRSVPSVKSIRSTSSRGSAEFSIFFNWNTDIVISLLQVEAAINQLLPTLPAGTSFLAQRMDPTIFPVFGLTLTSNVETLENLRDVAFFKLRPLLTSIPGVAKIEIAGGQQAEFQILVDPIKLQAKNLAFDDVSKSLVANNIITGVGRVEDYYRLYLVLSDTRLQTIDEINHTILHSGPNGIVEIEDVAQVIRGVVPQWIRVTAEGKDAVLVNIVQQIGANTVSIAKAIQSKLIQIHKHIPTDIKISTYYDQSRLIIAAALSVGGSILIGALFAALVLLFFLRNINMTLMVALILPCVLLSTAVFLHVFHMSFNIMTLGGMAAAVGLIIDDGVVMIEYLLRHLQENQSQGKEASLLNASTDMIRPLAGSSLATIIIFIPLTFLSGVVGGFFTALSVTMGTSLALSFLFVILVIPLLSERWLKSQNINPQSASALLDKAKSYYQYLMTRFLQNRLGLVLILGSLFLSGLLAFTQVGSGFMPKMDEGGFVLDYLSPPSTSLAETDRILRQVEKFILQIPEVDSFSRRTGLQLGGGLTESNKGDFFIRLKDQRSRDIQSIMTELRNKIESQIPGLQVETIQLMEDLIGDLTSVPQPIEIKIFGEDNNHLEVLAKQVAAIISHIKGVIEIKNGIVISGDAIIINVDRVKASFQNLDPESITKQIQTQLTGNVVSQIQEGQKSIGIRIWTPKNIRDRIDLLQTLYLRTTTGHYITLRDVASITIQKGQAEIMRENLKQLVAVSARIDNRDMGSVMHDVKAEINNKLILPTGTYIEYGGLYQEQQKSFFEMAIVLIAVILLVVVLLLFLYEDFYIMFSIIFISVLSLSGVFLGLRLTDTELNISAMMGLTMIVGIVTEIAIFYFSELITYPDHSKENIIKAGVKRLRPILMTSVITIMALVPLALGLGTGSTMQQPLAIAIISGLIVAMPLVLFIMPALYLALSNE